MYLCFMAYRALTRSTYEKLVAAFRSAPGNLANAARDAGVCRETAKKAWETGWKEWPWAPSVKQMFLDEEVAARARQRLDEEAARARVAERAAEQVHKDIDAVAQRNTARDDALSERIESAKLIKGCRQNLMALLGITAGWAREVYELQPQTRQALRGKNPDQIIAVGIQLGKLVSRLTDAVDKLQQMAAREVGDPTEIVQHTLQLDGSPEEAARFVALARRAAARSARLGLISQAAIDADLEPPEPQGMEVTPLPPDAPIPDLFDEEAPSLDE